MPHGGIIYASGWAKCGNVLKPLSNTVKTNIINKSKHSRPGPSFWKEAFLPWFPEWAQEAYWDIIDTQKACRSIAAASKKASQVNLDKSTGGVRLLTMLE